MLRPSIFWAEASEYPPSQSPVPMSGLPEQLAKVVLAERETASYCAI